MADYWKASSGQYAGHSDGKDFYNSRGKHVGIFNGSDLHSNRDGRCIATIVREKYLGKKTGGTTIGAYDRGSRGGGSKGNIGGSGSGHQDPDLGD